VKVAAATMPSPSPSSGPAPPTVSLQQVTAFYAQDKHAEVVLLWELLKHKSPASLTTELLTYFVESAEMERRPQLVITMVEFAQSCGVAAADRTCLRFVQACHRLAVDRADAAAWHKATGMLESHVFSRLRDRHQPESPRHVAEMIEETIQVCSESGKWRNCLDILEKAAEFHVKFTERMLTAAIVCSAREKNGVAAAFSLFLYMTRKDVDVPRSTKVYVVLLQGLARESAVDRYEVVWAQMAQDRVPRTDAAFASRVEVLSLSRLPGTGIAANLARAEQVLAEAQLSIKRPRATYHALHLAYLKVRPPSPYPRPLSGPLSILI